MSAIRALRQVAAPLVARRTLCTATAVPRVAGMRVASLASTQASKTTATRGFASSARRFGEGSCEYFLDCVYSMNALLTNPCFSISGCCARAEASGRVELREGDGWCFGGGSSIPEGFQGTRCMGSESFILSLISPHTSHVSPISYDDACSGLSTRAVYHWATFLFFPLPALLVFDNPGSLLSY